MKKKYLNLEFCHDLSAPNMKNWKIHHTSEKAPLTFVKTKTQSWSGFMVEWKLCVCVFCVPFFTLIVKGRTCCSCRNLHLPSYPLHTRHWGSGSVVIDICCMLRGSKSPFSFLVTPSWISPCTGYGRFTILGCSAWMSFFSLLHHLISLEIEMVQKRQCHDSLSGLFMLFGKRVEPVGIMPLDWIWSNV